MTNTITFEQLGIDEPILRVCFEEKFINPTEIQEKSIPHVIAGKDVIGEAATGSGKTLAFASGIIQNTKKGAGVQALIITPTRELAQQVADMIKKLSKYKPLKVLSIYGGVSINPQILGLRNADIVVGTPGRLIDHIERRTLRLRKVKILVLDECDRLLDMGFIPDVETIIRHLPRNRQTLLYSATISYEINNLAEKYLNEDYLLVNAKPFVDPSKLTQHYYGPVRDSEKFSLLAHLLKQNKADDLSMVFCNTRRSVDYLIDHLRKAGIDAVALHGGYSQYERNKRLKSFQKKVKRVLVATDVAARGLDIRGVTKIYNYDLPDNVKQYIHRIGRTARAGEAGKALTIVSQRDQEKFIHLFRNRRIKITKKRTPVFKRIATSYQLQSSGSRDNWNKKRFNPRRAGRGNSHFQQRNYKSSSKENGSRYFF